MTKRLYIETVGCQMNMLDSELVVASLRNEGYELVNSPQQADTILYNTCSVRQHAEDKIYSALGRLKDLKRQHPEKIVGVLGCMAQKDQKLIVERSPLVDLVVGPGQLHQIPRLLKEIASGEGRKIEVSLDRSAGSREKIEQSFESYDPLRDPQMRPSPYQAFVRIMIGCDKFCTYCIVPSVRGPEQSREPRHIEAEVRQLADEGCREVTLLGQTVNSYKHRENGRDVRLADLLYRLHDIDGLDRIKFVTNYPPRYVRRTARSGARPAQMFALFARAGAERVESCIETHEARLHRRRVPGDVPANSGHRSRCGGNQRFHRWLLRGNR